MAPHLADESYRELGRDSSVGLVYCFHQYICPHAGGVSLPKNQTILYLSEFNYVL